MGLSGFSDRSGSPLINTSIARQLRSGVFSGKTQVGPETSQGITEGALKSDADKAAQEANIQQQAEADQKRLAESERASRAQEQLSRDQLKAEEDRAAAAAHEAKKAAEQDSFISGLLGS